MFFNVISNGELVAESSSLLGAITTLSGVHLSDAKFTASVV